MRILALSLTLLTGPAFADSIIFPPTGGGTIFSDSVIFNNVGGPPSTLTLSQMLAISQSSGNFSAGALTYTPNDGRVANNSNTAVGWGAMASNTPLDSNTATGTSALAKTSAAMNAAFGARAGANSTTAQQATYIGSNAGLAYTTGGGTVAVGHGAVGGDDFAPAPATGILNTNVGSWSGQEFTSAYENSCVGVNSCMNYTTGNGNSALGTYALSGTYSSTATNGGNAASFNVGVGYGALRGTTQNDQVAVGRSSLYASTTGTHSVGIGSFTLTASVNDTANTALGDAVLAALNGGSSNTGAGASALVHATTASGTSAFGASAGYGITTGINNSIFGANSAVTITTGSNNTILGANVSGLSPSLSGAVILASGDGTILADFNKTTAFGWTFVAPFKSVINLTAIAVPAATSCGTSPTVNSGSTPNAGSFTIGTGATACTITFATPFPVNAYCTITPRAQPAALTNIPYISAQSNSAFTVSGGTASQSYAYTCGGN